MLYLFFTKYITKKTSETYLITFSPTRTSFKIGKAVLQGLGGEGEIIDLTYGETEHIDIPSDAVAVFSFPVYGGHIAPVAVERLKSISSSGRPSTGDLKQAEEFGQAIRRKIRLPL